MMKIWIKVFLAMVLFAAVERFVFIPAMDIWMRWAIRHNLSGYEFLAGSFIPFLILIPTAAAVIFRAK